MAYTSGEDVVDWMSSSCICGFFWPLDLPLPALLSTSNAMKVTQSWALNQNVAKRISKHSRDSPSNAQRPFYIHNIVDIIA